MGRYKKRSSIVTVRLDSDERERLREMAENDFMTVSAYIKKRLFALDARDTYQMWHGSFEDLSEKLSRNTTLLTKTLRLLVDVAMENGMEKEDVMRRLKDK